MGTHNDGANRAGANDEKVTQAQTEDEMDDGEDQSNGRNCFVATVLCRLHIGGCGRLGCDHRGCVGGLQVRGEHRRKEGQTGQVYCTSAKTVASYTSVAHCYNSYTLPWRCSTGSSRYAPLLHDQLYIAFRTVSKLVLIALTQTKGVLKSMAS